MNDYSWNYQSLNSQYDRIIDYASQVYKILSEIDKEGKNCSNRFPLTIFDNAGGNLKDYLPFKLGLFSIEGEGTSLDDLKITKKGKELKEKYCF